MKKNQINLPEKITFALKEEIGNTNLFVGREKELDYFLNWAINTKEELSKSTAIMSRRKRGKTALVQRLYNTFYSMNDPQIIPFYYKMKEGKLTQLDFSDEFFRSLITQYLAFKQKKPEIVNEIYSYDKLKELSNDQVLLGELEQMNTIYKNGESSQAWEHARGAGHRISIRKDERIIQIIDEFQFLNEFIYRDDACTNRIELASFYQHTADSKISPQIITGSQVGLLATIIRKMYFRYLEHNLGNFTDEEALKAVYNYSNIFHQPVTDETAQKIASIGINDPFYISQFFYSVFEPKDLTSLNSIVDIMKFETSASTGYIKKIWYEYFINAIRRINDENGKKIVTYLAKHSDRECGRDELLNELKLDLTDGQLEDRLFKLHKADLIEQGSTNFRYQGLKDPIFEEVFRGIYEEDIDKVGALQFQKEKDARLTSLTHKVSYYKGMAAEYRVINKFLFAAQNQTPLEKLVENYQHGIVLTPFTSIGKKKFNLDQERGIEVDIYCQSKDAKYADLAIEVKDWKTPIAKSSIDEFIQKTQDLKRIVKKPCSFIFYAENGISQEQAKLLEQNQIMYTDGEKIKFYDVQNTSRS
jgi:hypothetical protein